MFYTSPLIGRIQTECPVECEQGFTHTSLRRIYTKKALPQEDEYLGPEGARRYT